jgi:DHA1 family bicyclomycin/chloramphenicol resistance-like MFS transporter
LIVPFGWRAVFLAVTLVAIAGFVLVAVFLPETRPPEDRIKVSVGSVIAGFAELFRDWRFLGITFIGAFGMASFFTFLASSSFVYINHFGLTPTQYSMAFSVNAIGFIGASQFAAKLGGRFGMARVVMGAVSLYTFFALILFAVTASGVDNLAVLMTLLFASFAFLGLVIPSTMVLALEDHGPIAGMASALGGTLQMVTGGLLIVIGSLFSMETAFPMVSAIAFCAVCAFSLSAITLMRGAPKARAAE